MIILSLFYCISRACSLRLLPTGLRSKKPAPTGPEKFRRLDNASSHSLHDTKPTLLRPPKYILKDSHKMPRDKYVNAVIRTLVNLELNRRLCHTLPGLFRCDVSCVHGAILSMYYCTTTYISYVPCASEEFDPTIERCLLV